MQKLDYVKVVTKIDKSGIHLFPKFDIKKSNDVMIRGSSFYAIWNEAENRWSRDPFDAVRLVDEQIAEEAAKYPKVAILTFHICEIKTSGISGSHILRMLQTIITSLMLILHF